MRPALCLLASVVLASLAACSSDSFQPADPPAVDAGATPPPLDAAVTNDAPTESGCPRAANTTDRVRKVIVSHPNDANAAKSNDYEVLELGLDGNLTRNGPHFAMGRNFDAPIVFSPDGNIGIAVQDEDGTLGVFRFDPNVAAPVVVSPSFGKDLFYAGAAVFSPDGSRVYVTDSNRNTTGGVHEVAIACDGTPTYRGRVLEAPGADAITFVPGTSRALTVAASSPGAAKGNDVFLVDVNAGAASTIASSIALFGDGELDPRGVGITPDGRVALVPDSNDVYGTNRLGVVAVAANGLKKLSVLALEGPSGVAISPYGNAALVTAAGGSTIDALHWLKIDTNNASTPVTNAGKLTTTPKPQLPTGPVVLREGKLKGLVLVSEVEGIRRLQFEANGTMKDLGLYVLQGGLEASPGAVGVQP